MERGDKMRKLLIGILMFILMSQSAWALTFPIDLENCIMQNGRVLLTGWFTQKRAYGTHKALDIPAF